MRSERLIDQSVDSDQYEAIYTETERRSQYKQLNNVSCKNIID